MKLLPLTISLVSLATISYANDPRVDGTFITSVNKYGNLVTSNKAIIIADKNSRYDEGDIIFKANETESGLRLNGNTYIQVEDKVIKIDDSNGTATSEYFDSNHNVDITNFR